MVELRGLNKHYGALHVLKAINLSFSGGNISAVVGPNASGKTTLLKTILGLVVPDNGEVRIAGNIVHKNDWRYRSQIGYMPQTPRFPENLTVSEVLALVERVRGARPVAKPDLLNLFQLAAFYDKPIGKLSTGTRQKVNAVAAMMFDVPILVCDEPTAGLDPVASSRLKEWLQQERGRGKTIILTSHHMAEIEELADPVVFLLDGEVRLTGSTREICNLTGEATLEKAIARLMQERI